MVLIRPITNKIPYELIQGITKESYFMDLSTKCFLHNNGKRKLGKFDKRNDEGVFLGSAIDNKAN